jgi:hypothetical protein
LGFFGRFSGFSMKIPEQAAIQRRRDALRPGSASHRAKNQA